MPAILEAPPAKPDAQASPDITPAKTREVIDQFMVFTNPNKKAKVDKSKDEKPKEDKPKSDGSKSQPTGETHIDHPIDPKPDADEKSEPKAKKEKPAPSVDPQLIAESVGEAVERVMQRREKPEVVHKVEPQSQLPVAEQKRQKNLETLEKLFPDEYRDISTERARFLEKQRKYEEKWSAENPDKEFDPDAPEHDDFFGQDPLNRIAPDHLAEAIAEQRIASERASINERMAGMERQNRVLPLAERESATVATRVAADVGGKDLMAIVNPDGTINDDKFQEMLMVDPERAQVVANAAYTARTLTNEAVKIFNEVTSFNPAKNEAHAEIDRIWRTAEERLQQLDADEWRKSDPRGRSLKNFVPYEKFYQLPFAKRAGKWSLDEADLKELVALDIAQIAKKTIKSRGSSFEEEAKRRGYVPATEKKAPKPDAKEVVEKPDEDEDEPSSPSSATEPKLAGVKGNPKTDAEKRIDALWKGLWGR